MRFLLNRHREETATELVTQFIRNGSLKRETFRAFFASYEAQLYGLLIHESADCSLNHSLISRQNGVSPSSIAVALNRFKSLEIPGKSGLAPSAQHARKPSLGERATQVACTPSCIPALHAHPRASRSYTRGISSIFCLSSASISRIAASASARFWRPSA